jgi:hypothetical protein
MQGTGIVVLKTTSVSRVEDCRCQVRVPIVLVDYEVHKGVYTVSYMPRWKPKVVAEEVAPKVLDCSSIG